MSRHGKCTCEKAAMPWLSWWTSPRRCIEDARLSVNPRHWLTLPCSVVFIAGYNKCVVLLSKWATLNAAPCRRPVMTLDCVLLKNKSQVFALRPGPEINSRACLWVQPRSHHLAECWLSNKSLIFLLILCLETPKDGSGPTNFRTEPSANEHNCLYQIRKAEVPQHQL